MRDDPVDSYLQRRRRQRLLVAALALVAGALGWGWKTHGLALRRKLGFGYNLRVEQSLRTPAPSMLGTVELGEVHRRLLPVLFPLVVPDPSR